MIGLEAGPGVLIQGVENDRSENGNGYSKLVESNK